MANACARWFTLQIVGEMITPRKLLTTQAWTHWPPTPLRVHTFIKDCTQRNNNHFARTTHTHGSGAALVRWHWCWEQDGERWSWWFDIKLWPYLSSDTMQQQHYIVKSTGHWTKQDKLSSILSTWNAINKNPFNMINTLRSFETASESTLICLLLCCWNLEELRSFWHGQKTMQISVQYSQNPCCASNVCFPSIFWNDITVRYYQHIDRTRTDGYYTCAFTYDEKGDSVTHIALSMVWCIGHGWW